MQSRLGVPAGLKTTGGTAGHVTSAAGEPQAMMQWTSEAQRHPGRDTISVSNIPIMVYTG